MQVKTHCCTADYHEGCRGCAHRAARADQSAGCQHGRAVSGKLHGIAHVQCTSLQLPLWQAEASYCNQAMTLICKPCLNVRTRCTEHIQLRQCRRKAAYDQLPSTFAVSAQPVLDQAPGGGPWYLCLQGIPFFHAGSNILRSKSLDRDSYNSGKCVLCHMLRSACLFTLQIAQL